MLVKTALVALSAVVTVLAVDPVESGDWVPYTPGSDIQECEGGVVDGDNFFIPTSPEGGSTSGACSNGHLRAEQRFTDDYTTGVKQFGGIFTINAMTGTRISIKQTFNGDTGPYFILAVETGGTLYSVEGGAVLQTDVATVGTPVQINTVHNADINAFRCYVNGVQLFSDDDAPGGSFYDKIGAYTTDSGTGDLNITWTEVEFWNRDDS